MTSQFSRSCGNRTAVGGDDAVAPSNFAIDDDCELFEENDSTDMVDGEATESLSAFAPLNVKELPVFDSSNMSSGETVGSVSVDERVWGVPVRKDIVHRVVCWQRAGWRQGTSKTKTRGEVRGGGKKPWTQKGTGRARHGSIRSPIWRGGGHAHAKRPKDWSYSLNRKVRRMGLRVALSAKMREGNVVVIDEAKIGEGKTSEIVSMLESGSMTRDDCENGVLFLDEPVDLDFARASQNIPSREFHALSVGDLIETSNVYDIVLREKLLLTRDAFETIQTSLSE